MRSFRGSPDVPPAGARHAGGVTFTLRPARPTDGPALSAVLTAAGTAAWGPFLGEERVRAATSASAPRADVVAEDADGLLGFVAYDAATGEIQLLHTHPRAWGRGAGRALLDHALDALRGAGRTRAFLNTEVRNERAVAFYLRHGWHVEGEPRVREWHGVRLVEPTFVRAL